MSKSFLCPVDQSPLVLSERHGVEIDYCPTCRGVWLDRGELDKIIEKNSASTVTHASPQQREQGHWPDHSRQGEHRGYGHKPYKRRKSFLEELFD